MAWGCGKLSGQVDATRLACALSQHHPRLAGGNEQRVFPLHPPPPGAPTDVETPGKRTATNEEPAGRKKNTQKGTAPMSSKLLPLTDWLGFSPEPDKVGKWCGGRGICERQKGPASGLCLDLKSPHPCPRHLLVWRSGRLAGLPLVLGRSWLTQLGHRGEQQRCNELSPGPPSHGFASYFGVRINACTTMCGRYTCVSTDP